MDLGEQKPRLSFYGRSLAVSSASATEVPPKTSANMWVSCTSPDGKNVLTVPLRFVNVVAPLAACPAALFVISPAYNGRCLSLLLYCFSCSAFLADVRTYHVARYSLGQKAS